jgi:histidyl-tRNA synthetase
MERVCALYGYRRIQTPVFEDTELFRRTSGAGSDIVQKEMYTFEDRGGRSLTLRPEATAPVCRAYVEHGMHRDPQPVKLYTVAPMYRYAAPQRGRYREHWQLSVEAIGSDDPALDAEVIELYHALLGRLGVSEFRLVLNSIGCRECRPAYVDRLREWLELNLSRLDEATRAKAAANPLRIFDNLEAKPPDVQAALREAPTIGDSLCEACREHFAAARRHLDSVDVSYELEPTLVLRARGRGRSRARGGLAPGSPRAGDRERHRLRRPLAQGPADAGRSAGSHDDGRRPCGRGVHQASGSRR